MTASSHAASRAACGELERAAHPVADGRDRVGPGHLVRHLVLQQRERQRGRQPAVLARRGARGLPQGGQVRRLPTRAGRGARVEARAAAAPACPAAAGRHRPRRAPASRGRRPGASRVSSAAGSGPVGAAEGHGHLAAHLGVGVLRHPGQQSPALGAGGRAGRLAAHGRPPGPWSAPGAGGVRHVGAVAPERRRSPRAPRARRSAP